MSGLKEGFRIGFKGDGYRCHSAKANMKSAWEQPQVVSEYLMEECAAGRVLGPFKMDYPLVSDLTVNHFGVIPKGSTRKW